MKLASSRQRIFWTLIIAVSFFSLLQATITYLVLETLEDEIADALVMSQMKSTIKGIDNHTLSTLPIERQIMDDLTVWIGDHPNIPHDIIKLENGLHYLNLSEKTLHIAISTHQGHQVRVVYDASVNENKIHYATLVISAVALLSILITIVLAQRISAAITRSHENLANYIRNWHSHPTLLGNANNNDDSQIILSAFNEMQTKMTKIVADESRFAAKLNHELRNLLTLIRTDSELALIPSLSAEDRAVRLTHILKTVDIIEANLRILSAQNLRQHTENIETFYLHEVLQQLCYLINKKDLIIVLNIATDTQIKTNKHAFFMIVRNLVQNVLDHAQATTLTISFTSPGQLSFLDNGKGISTTQLEYIFESYLHYSRHDLNDTAGIKDEASHNAGLGLNIVRQLCLQQGWDITIDSQNHRPSYTNIILKFNENSTIIK